MRIPQWSDGVYGMNSTTTRYTTLGISEENKKIEEEEEDPNDTYLKKNNNYGIGKKIKLKYKNHTRSQIGTSECNYDYPSNYIKHLFN